MTKEQAAAEKPRITRNDVYNIPLTDAEREVQVTFVSGIEKIAFNSGRSVGYVAGWQAREREGWISVEERLPEEGQLVRAYQKNELHPEWEHLIVRFSKGVFISSRSDADDEEDFGGEYPYISHWMPLPSAPEPDTNPNN